MKANNKKPKDGQSDNGSDSDKATKSITCCITTLYTSKPASDSTADIRFNVTDCFIPTTNVAWLHDNIRPPLKKLVLDSGTTAHLIANKDLIQGYYEDFEQYQTGSGKLLSSYGKGTLPMALDEGNLTLLNVYYAPDLGYNLISTILLGRKGVEVFLRTLNKLSQILHQGKVLRYTDSIDSQYVICQKPGVVANTHRSDQPMKAKPTEYAIWHERMAHLGYRNLKKLTNTATGVEFKGSPPEETCEGCMAGR